MHMIVSRCAMCFYVGGHLGLSLGPTQKIGTWGGG